MVAILDEIKSIYKDRGGLKYGENITQLEHAVQCWQLAKRANADIETRVAAFLHDIGHLFYNPELTMNAEDLKHEELAARLLTAWKFPDKVVQLVQSHVWAKRYLVAFESNYIDQLSVASIDSLIKQGGPMSDEEAVEYRKKPYFTECLLLRRWDDYGKLDIDSDEIPEQVWTDIHTVLTVSTIS